MDTSKAAAALGRLGGRAGRGASQVRGDADHYRAIRAKRHPLAYVADHRSIRYAQDGRRIVEGGWQVMWWDGLRSIYVEGGVYSSRREAQDAVREQRQRDRA